MTRKQTSVIKQIHSFGNVRPIIRREENDFNDSTEFD